ncbi:UDP-forming cellulose synthase catalytic subunit [Methylobacterium iners]|uniref:UDP-forming cellulose synthase catalytic subunit n=1 Tax=Methylobacterium iners TaxID=418707 RepID=UPI001EE21FB4|nr:UDP-forming cellulose synthase catalytic subunit [Methylobacterium iners]
MRWTAWGSSGALALAFLTHPVSVQAQLILSLSALAGMAALWLVAPRRGVARMGFIALGSLVVLRYVYWRISETLPSAEDSVSFGLGLLLLAAELYCVVILAVSLTINADPLVRPKLSAVDEEDLPSVDIFIPTYNEDAEILATTVAAACNLDYPRDRFTVWLLDDGGTDQKCADADPDRAAGARARRARLQALCADLGARYLTRARNEHAKAGNLNSGLNSSDGEIVVVLDADHAPFRSFLRETIGHFAADPKLFLVQTPHVFLNPDPIERNLRTFERMPSENEMFYSVTQRGLDKWNGSFFCGSAALLRRVALDEVGGFSGITITEDCETALELHARGWTSAYVDTPLIAGLQPENFADFIGQRARWCQGMFQILILKNPLMKPGLRPIQRLGYLSSMLFWLFPLPRLVFMLAPLLHIFFDVKIFVSSIDEALAFTAMYVAGNLMLQNYLYGHVRWPWVSELYEYVQGVYLARSIASVIVAPRKPSFTVTAKGRTLDQNHLSSLALPFFVIFAVLALGVATAAWRYLYEPGVTGLMIVVGLWCLFNLVVAGAALGVVAERRQPDRWPSLRVAREGTVELNGDRFAVAIESISVSGCTLRRSDGSVWPTGGDGRLVGTSIPSRSSLDALAFHVSGTAGVDTRIVTFASLADRDFRALADLMYADATALETFLAGRRRSPGLVAGSLRFLTWGLTEPIRAMRYALARRPTSIASAETGARAIAEAKAAVVQPLAERVANDTSQSTLLDVQVVDQGVPSRQLVAAAASPPQPFFEAPALAADVWREVVAALGRQELGGSVVAETSEAAPEASTSTDFDPAKWMEWLYKLDETERPFADRSETSRPLPSSAQTRQAA